MRPEDVRIMLRRQPFQPFRLYVLENTVYEVRHQELVILSQSTLTLHQPKFGPPLFIAQKDHRMIISLLHISRMEPIPSSPSSSGNGAPS